VIRASRLHRHAVFALAIFIATVGVTLFAPLFHPVVYDEVCSADGRHYFVADDASHSSHDDHAAHCPLCMPAGAPPAAIVFAFEAVQPLAHVRQSIPAARLASLVGAPLPARGPPSFA